MFYKEYIGRIYEGPHGCLMLAADILRDTFNLPVPNDVAERVFETLRTQMRPVDDPQPGDVVLMRGPVWHVGVVIGTGTMIHTSAPTGVVVVERFDSLQYRARIRGYYRWQ